MTTTRLSSHAGRSRTWRAHWGAFCGLVLVGMSWPPGAAANPGASRLGFLVVAPDRGFLGNEEVRDAFAPFAEDHRAQLVFATDERMGPYLERAVDELARAGAQEVVVLPFFVSAHDPRLELVRRLAGRMALPVPLSFARIFGESYLAVEILADRLREVEPAAGRRLVVVGTGATGEEHRRLLTAELEELAGYAARGFGFAGVDAVVAPAGDAPEGLRAAYEADLAAATGGGPVLVAPFHLGPKLDGMMSFSAWLGSRLPEEAVMTAGEITPHEAVTLWLEREANRHQPLAPEQVGVVILAHGADFHWNETILEAVAPVALQYTVEASFSMADRDLLERAVHRLEERGARAVVVVRVFGLEASFRSTVEHLLGLDVEGAAGAAAPAAAGGHGHHGHGHGAGGGGRPAPRIRTALPAATVGGLEDHPLFARALLDRARELSRDPARETVLLAAHGSGDEAQNEHWRQLLSSLSRQIRELGGGDFAAIEAVTWREDWPQLREPEITRARELVERVSAAGGRVLVVPARTTGRGPESELLAGLEVATGVGFAPHPLFTRWVEEQISRGIAALPLPPPQPGVAAASTAAGHHPGL
jgi:sirohydrochlorin ferrochelatase